MKFRKSVRLCWLLFVAFLLNFAVWVNAEFDWRLTAENLSDVCYAYSDLIFCDSRWITSIAPWTFDNMSIVTSIILSNNQIVEIEHWTFRGLTRLITLDLSNNRISGLKSWTFEWLNWLKSLNLVGNEIEEIEPYVFSWMLLTWLDLSNQKLQKLY